MNPINHSGVSSNNSETAGQANNLSNMTCKAAIQGGTAMDTIVHTMDDIAKSSERISNIIGVVLTVLHFKPTYWH